MEATLHVRAHLLTVNIVYDAKSVKFSYKNSHELLYKKDDDDKEFIHYRANTWLQNTGSNIYYALNNVCQSQRGEK